MESKKFDLALPREQGFQQVNAEGYILKTAASIDSAEVTLNEETHHLLRRRRKIGVNKHFSRYKP
jgi:hypothetical protein